MSASIISRGDSQPSPGGLKARIWWFAVLAMFLGGVIYLPLVGNVISCGMLFVTYFPILHLAPRFAASLHPDRTSGWFPLLRCAEFPVFFPLPTASGIVAIIGLRRLHRYGNALLGLGCTEKFLMWTWVMYCFALTSVALTLMVACFFGVSSVIY